MENETNILDKDQAAIAAANDNMGIGMKILCFLIPLVGIILYFTNRKDSPNRASSAIKAAGAGIVVSIVLNVIARAAAH